MSYYDDNARSFFDGTVAVEMAPLYERFLPLIKPQGKILDAGCGSGRDSLYFINHNYQVVAFDASPALVDLASKHTQQPVKLAQFLSFDAPADQFDGIWACASLLHVPYSLLTETFIHLAKMLKSDGAFYCSFKYGDDEVERDQRTFTNLNECLLSQVLQGTSLTVQSTWVTSDLRPGRQQEQWLNAILMKS